MKIVGQESILADLSIHAQFSVESGTTLPEILISGPSGYGKTTIAHYLAEKMGVLGNKKSPKFIRVMGEDLTSRNGMEDFAYSIGKNDVVLIDEIQNLATKKGMRELLFEIIDYRTFGGGKLNPFSIVAATTVLGDLPAELHNRVMLKYQLTHYTEDNIKQILMNLGAPEEVAKFIAQRGRCNPRESKLLFKRASREASMLGRSIDIPMVQQMFIRIGIDDIGLNNDDRRILSGMYGKQTWLRRNAMGVNSIAEMVGMKEPEYRISHEPYLVKIGFLHKTARGRILTIPGKEYVESLNEQ